MAISLVVVVMVMFIATLVFIINLLLYIAYLHDKSCQIFFTNFNVVLLFLNMKTAVVMVVFGFILWSTGAQDKLAPLIHVVYLLHTVACIIFVCSVMEQRLKVNKRPASFNLAKTLGIYCLICMLYVPTYICLSENGPSMYFLIMHQSKGQAIFSIAIFAGSIATTLVLAIKALVHNLASSSPKPVAGVILSKRRMKFNCVMFLIPYVLCLMLPLISNLLNALRIIPNTTALQFKVIMLFLYQLLVPPLYMLLTNGHLQTPFIDLFSSCKKVQVEPSSRLSQPTLGEQVCLQSYQRPACGAGFCKIQIPTKVNQQPAVSSGCHLNGKTEEERDHTEVCAKMPELC